MDRAEISRISRQPFRYRAMRRSTFRLDTDSAVDCRPDSLLAAQVSLGGLDRDVTEKKLDLFQLAAGGMAQPRACSPQVMGSQLVDPGFLGELADNVPNNLFSHALTPSFPGPIHTAKNFARSDPAAFDHSSRTFLTQSGMGTVRVCPAFPTISTMAQCCSRC